MRNRSQYRDKVTRQAGLKLTLCALIIFGFTGVIMQFTVWNHPVLSAREPFYTTCLVWT